MLLAFSMALVDIKTTNEAVWAEVSLRALATLMSFERTSGRSRRWAIFRALSAVRLD